MTGGMLQERCPGPACHCAAGQMAGRRAFELCSCLSSQRMHWRRQVQRCLVGCLANHILYAYMLPGTTAEARMQSWRILARRELHDMTNGTSTIHVACLGA